MKEMLEVMIKNLVGKPEVVEITEKQKGNTTIYEVKVDESDMGKVIGRQGRIAKSIRTVAKAIATKEDKKINIEFVGWVAMEQLMEIGQIVNTYGIKGFLKVVPYTDDITRFEDLKSIYIQTKNTLKTAIIEEVKYSKNLVLLKLKGIDDINQAEIYKNCYIKIDRKDAVELPEDSYFIVDLIGLNVYTDDGKELGNIIDVYPTGANDIYVVKNEIGKQVLLPAIGDVIKNVDIENKKMIVHLIEGLI